MGVPVYPAPSNGWDGLPLAVLFLRVSLPPMAAVELWIGLICRRFGQRARQSGGRLSTGSSPPDK